MPSRKFRDFAGAALALSRISLMPALYYEFVVNMFCVSIKLSPPPLKESYINGEVSSVNITLDGTMYPG
jgi:hypothetical protein